MSDLENCTALQNGELCGWCELKGRCRNLTYKVITPGQITRELLLVARQTICELAAEHKIKAPYMPQFIIDRSYKILGRWVHPVTNETQDPEIELLWYDKRHSTYGFKLDVGSPDSVRNWYYYQYIVPYRGQGLPYLPSDKYLRRHAVVFSIIRAAFTERSEHWPVPE